MTGATDEAMAAARNGDPLYRRVADALRLEIDGLHPGAALASESELERRFGVSRITVRRALDLLAQSGLVVRRQGSGTFVARPKVAERLGVLHSWTEGMRALGLEPRTVDCTMLRVEPPDWVASALGLEPAHAETVLRVQRLRYANDEPLCLMVDYLRSRHVPDLAEGGLLGESLYETLERRYGLRLARVEDTVTARAATLFESGLLGVTAGAPVLHVTRVTYLATGEPLGAAAVVSRADRYAYRVTGRPTPSEPSTM
jgi:GntR family transcriptional regulator